MQNDRITLAAVSGGRHLLVSDTPGFDVVQLVDLTFAPAAGSTATVAGCGGAILADSGATVALDSSNVTGNRASTGGGVCARPFRVLELSRQELFEKGARRCPC